MLSGDRLIYKMLKDTMRHKNVTYKSIRRDACSISSSKQEEIIISCSSFDGYVDGYVEYNKNRHVFKSGTILDELVTSICETQYFLQKDRDNLQSSLKLFDK